MQIYEFFVESPTILSKKMLTAVQKSLIFAIYQRILCYRGCKKPLFLRIFVRWEKEVFKAQLPNTTNS